MNQAVYNTISGFNLLDNYKVHYYFDTYAGGASNAHVYSDADSQYSGKIFSYEGGAHSAASLDLFTGNLGTGTFSGGLNTFYDYISIDNYGDLFSGEFAFLINAQTTSRQDLGESQKGPVSNSNILFSNLKGGEIVSVGPDGEPCTGTHYGGWQIGINAANRMYLESYNGFEPVIITYMGETIPSSDNIWGVVYEDGAARVGLYSVGAEAFSFNSSAIIPDSMATTGLWRIGSGVNFDPNVKFSTQLTLNSGLFAGKMDNFIYFNTGLSDSELNDVAKSLYSDLYVATPPSFTSGDTVFFFDGVTGTEQSGVIGTTTECSETGTVTEDISFTHKEAVRGNIGVGELHFVVNSTGFHPISGTVTGYRHIRSTEGLTDVITGFTITNHETGIITSLSGCSGVDVSGAVVNEFGVLASGAGGFTGTVASGVSGISGDIPSTLRPDSFSYIGIPITTEGVIEKYNVGSFGSSEQGSLNNLANIGSARLGDGQGFFMSKTGTSNSLSFYLNGVGREQGKIEVRTDSTSEVFTENGVTFARTACGTIIPLTTATNFEIQTFFNSYTITSGSCFVSGLQILDTLSFPLGMSNILELYDTGLNTATVRSRWEVTSLYEYESPPDPNPISGDQWVFFNGQKLVSGINYFNDAGFVPSGYITEITGTYFTFPQVSGTTQSTGSNLSFEESPFFPNSNIIFINGVRQELSAYYVEHSSTKDLISGKQTLQTYGVSVYNNYI
jgi:hypothetical protein